MGRSKGKLRRAAEASASKASAGKKSSSGGGMTRGLRRALDSDPDLARLKADRRESMMDKVDQLRRFRESEAAARGEKGYGGSIYRGNEYAFDEFLRRRRGRGSAASSILSSLK